MTLDTGQNPRVVIKTCSANIDQRQTQEKGGEKENLEESEYNMYFFIESETPSFHRSFDNTVTCTIELNRDQAGF